MAFQLQISKMFAAMITGALLCSQYSQAVAAVAADPKVLESFTGKFSTLDIRHH